MISKALLRWCTIHNLTQQFDLFQVRSILATLQYNSSEVLCSDESILPEQQIKWPFSSGDGIFSALELNWHKWRQHYHRGRGGGHPEVIKQFMDTHHLITTLFEVGVLWLEQTFPVPQILYRPNCCTWAFWLAFLIHTRFHVKGTWPVRCQTLNWWHWWNFPTWTQMVWWV